MSFILSLKNKSWIKAWNKWSIIKLFASNKRKQKNCSWIQQFDGLKLCRIRMIWSCRTENIFFICLFLYISGHSSPKKQWKMNSFCPFFRWVLPQQFSKENICVKAVNAGMSQLSYRWGNWGIMNLSSLSKD